VQGNADSGSQAKEKVEVSSFLSEIKLDKYFDKFIENGVEDMETILEMKDEHIE